MNHKFIKNLKLVAKYRRMGFETWLKAYKIMPPDKQKEFQSSVLADARDIRQKQNLDKEISRLVPSK